jgi:5-methylcytosine-specific restriction enzyme subunit McrC
MLAASMRMPKTVEQLGHAMLLLEDVEDVAVNASLLDRVVINRRNVRFEELFVFCRMLLEGHAPGATSGGTKTYSFLFDMNAVFEKFVAAFLRKRVLPLLPGHRLVEQGKQQRKFLVRQDGRGVLQLKPDLTVIAPDGTKLVIDTKWKRMQSEREDGRLRIGNGDLYQLYAYADRFDARRSLLLYPKLPQSREQDFELVDPREMQTGRHLGVRFVNLHRKLSSAMERQKLADELKTMIQAGLAVAPSAALA